MDQISCPSCGKQNPADNKFCDFCLSDLHPADGGEIESGVQVPPLPGDNREGLGSHETDSDVPDWLSELQVSSQANDEGSIRKDSDEEHQPDEFTGWMATCAG